MTDTYSVFQKDARNMGHLRIEIQARAISLHVGRLSSDKSTEVNGLRVGLEKGEEEELEHEGQRRLS